METRRTIWEVEGIKVPTLTRAEAYINRFCVEAKKEAGELRPGEKWDENHQITGKPSNYTIKIRLEIVTT